MHGRTVGVFAQPELDSVSELRGIRTVEKYDEIDKIVHERQNRCIPGP